MSEQAVLEVTPIPQADNRPGQVPADSAISWPIKHEILGVAVSATTYEECCRKLLDAAKLRIPAIASFHAVHAIVESANSKELLDKVNAFQIVAPDGQPVRWALNWLYGARLQDRVYGPQLTWRICQQAAAEGVSIYLYGGSPATLEKLQSRLQSEFPQLMIVGAESPPFRKLTAEEDQQVVERINQSGAGLLLIGLGCPKQDHFAGDHAQSIRAVQLCVGAAFDFHAGAKPMAPAWMQRSGLEWLFRLSKEPGRLWKRYLFTNTQYATSVLWQGLMGRKKTRVMESGWDGT